MCHIVSYNTGKWGEKYHSGSKIPAYQWVLLGNGKFSDTAHTPVKQRGQWGASGGERARVTQPCQPHPRCIVWAGKRIISSFFPSAVNKQRCYHTLESLIAVTWAGWKVECQREWHNLRASAGTMGRTECGCHAVVSQHKLAHATKKLGTNICIILILLYPRASLFSLMLHNTV